jgi:hypothetical protein
MPTGEQLADFGRSWMEYLYSTGGCIAAIPAADQHDPAIVQRNYCRPEPTSSHESTNGTFRSLRSV